VDDVIREVIPYLPEEAAKVMEELSVTERKNLREIRIKTDGALFITLGYERRVFPRVSFSKGEVEACFRKVCGSSAYTDRHEIREGFVTLSGGHRVGILGTAVMGEDGKVEGIRDVTGLVFRISRDLHVDVSALMRRMILPDRVRNMMIVGPPGSGKTTVLRALTRALAERIQLAAVDEREELFPLSRPVPVGCDVLRRFPKPAGILLALRNLGPQMIVCDEIGTEVEVNAMGDGLRGGVGLLCTAHAYSVSELVSRPPVRRLSDLGGLDLIALLDPERIGSVHMILERKSLFGEDGSSVSDLCSLSGNGDSVRVGSVLPAASD